MILSGWGRYPRHETVLRKPGSAAAVRTSLAADAPGIARGNGRAYGDAAIGVGSTMQMLSLDRALALAEETGSIRVEAGMLLSRLIELLLPRGYFPPVVPGTSFVTVGGMVASDVHGKNHHKDGSIGDHVVWLRLLLPSGETVTCSAAENRDLFYATMGGMGLTGVILEVEMTLLPVESGWIRNRTVVAPDLAAALAALAENVDATYSVAWIDCLAGGARLGRSLVYLGEHAPADEVLAVGRPLFASHRAGRLRVPFNVPEIAMNPLSMRLFNQVYYSSGARRAGPGGLVDIRSFFFPLDSVRDWNRLYGKNGFVQFQVALPMAAAERGLSEMLGEIGRSGFASFLAVLKLFGPGGRPASPLSFPLEGATLALDFPMRAATLPLMARLEEMTRRLGGRIYLAKDAVQSIETLEAGYPLLGQFRDLRKHLPEGTRLQSRQSQRLQL